MTAAIGAIGIEPGDEVIVSPWTMSASATAILHWNAIPVFADIENETYNLDPASVEANVTENTKAIVAIDIFGHSADIDELRKIADKYGLKIISDTAQAPGSMYKGKFSGTLADIGGYSLNYHKHIHTGEGGILVTNDDVLAERLQLIRNHAESVVGGKGVANLCNMIGYNFRLGEIECAIGIEQLAKLDQLIMKRQKIAAKLMDGLSALPALTMPVTKRNCTHVYYAFPMKFDEIAAGVKTAAVYEALTAEGVPVNNQYCNLHLLPMYQKKIAYGSNGFPWNSGICRREVSYSKGICPVAESLNVSGFLSLKMCTFDYNERDVDAIVLAFTKVWKGLRINGC